MKRSSSFSVLAGAPAFLLLAGCSAISSYDDHVDGPRNGLVYYVPKTDYQVQFTIAQATGKDPADTTKSLATSTIDITCNPVFVADRSVGPFTLHSSANELFDRDHQLKMEDGLLTSVEIKDDGRIVEIAKQLGDAAKIVIAAQAGPAGLAVKSLQGPGLTGGAVPTTLLSLPAAPNLEPVPEPETDPRPTPTEAAYLLADVTPGTHHWYLSDSAKPFTLPGAGGRLKVIWERRSLGDKGGLAAVIPDRPARNCGPMPGIAARNTTKAGIHFKIAAESGAIAQLRAAAARRNVDALTKHLADLGEYNQRYGLDAAALGESGVRSNSLGNFPSSETDAEAGTRRNLQLTKSVLVSRSSETARLKGKFEKLAAYYKSGISKTIPISLKEEDMVVSTTVDERIVVIPLTRGPVGETTQTVLLTHGTVTNWSFKKKSAVEGLVQIPIELAKDIIGIPAAAVENDKTRTDAQTSLIQSKTQMLEAQATLAEKRQALELPKKETTPKEE